MSQANEPTRLDCIILGAGPAGLSAGLWLSKLALSFVILETRPDILSAVRQINLPIADVLGLDRIKGRELATRFEAHIQDKTLPILMGQRAIVQHGESPFRVQTRDKVWQSTCLIVATGLRRRRLGLPGEEELLGHSLTLSATTDRDWLAGKRVAVVGGGDGAAENALILTECCPEVSLIHRGKRLRAREEFQHKLLDPKTRTTQGKNVEIFPESTIQAFQQNGQKLLGLTVNQAGTIRNLAVDALVVKIGFEPNLKGLESLELAGTEQGLLRVSRELESSVPGVFAAGDVSNPLAPSLSCAMGDGVMAAKSAERFVKKQNRPT